MDLIEGFMCDEIEPLTSQLEILPIPVENGTHFNNKKRPRDSSDSESDTDSKI